MSKILVIGGANIDTTHYLATAFPKELTQECVNEIKNTARVLGGKGANQARATKLQSKEEEVYFVGCVGKDEAADSMIEEFRRVGINFSGVKVLDGFKTDHIIIQVDANGDSRKMMGYGDCIKQLTPELIDRDLLQTADIVAIQMKMPAETVRYVIEYCREHGKTLIIDPTPSKKSGMLAEGDLSLLKGATYLTPNEEEAFILSKYIQGKTLEEANQEFKQTSREERLEEISVLVSEYPNIVATIGEEGVMYNKAGKVIRKATYPTKCVDSTGAGDTFNGAFIASLSRGESLDKAIDFGLMASSVKVRYPGAQNGVPTYDETVKEFKALEKVHEYNR